MLHIGAVLSLAVKTKYPWKSINTWPVLQHRKSVAQTKLSPSEDRQIPPRRPCKPGSRAKRMRSWIVILKRWIASLRWSIEALRRWIASLRWWIEVLRWWIAGREIVLKAWVGRLKHWEAPVKPLSPVSPIFFALFYDEASPHLTLC